MGKRRNPRCGRHQFTAETMRNELFEKYYKGQGLVPECEWDTFMLSLQQELPITFRVTGFRDQNKELLRLIRSRYRDDICKLQFASESDVSPTTVNFGPLPWYPNDLAWQLDTNRYVVRKTPELKNLHQFLVSEMESGNISRQEAVSMLPPLLMDIRAHHSILDLCAAPGSKSSQMVELLHAAAEQQPVVGSRDSTQLPTRSPYVEPSGLVIANDVDQKRCYMMVHQMKRLQSPCTVITQEDATRFPRLFVPSVRTTDYSKCCAENDTEQLFFDRISADVPCSGDGTLRKNRDIWFRWNPNLGISEHYLQARILRRGLELLDDRRIDEESSRLVYSTCSFNPLENEAVVAHVLQACQGAVRLVEPERLSKLLKVTTSTLASDFTTASGVQPEFKFRPGMTTWRVMTKKGEWFDTYEQLPQSLQSNLRPSLFPPSADQLVNLHLDRCMRVLPHDQNTGGFFIAVLEKVAPLPWLRSRQPMENKFTSDTTTEVENVSNMETIAADYDATKSMTAKRTYENNSSIEVTSQIVKKKPRIFNETPFTYIDPLTDTDWPKIREYYGIPDPTNGFPDDSLMKSSIPPYFCPSKLLFRYGGGSNGGGGGGGDNEDDQNDDDTGAHLKFDHFRRRLFYYTNERVRDVVTLNTNRIKLVNTGVRMFAVVQDKQFTGYRPLQDGIELSDAVIPDCSNRRIHLGPDQYSDLVLILEEEAPLVENMSLRTREQWDRLDPGPVLFDFDPALSSVSEQSPSLPRCRLVFSGWRGLRSLRHYVGRHERLHLMRLANIDPKPPLTLKAAREQDVDQLTILNDQQANPSNVNSTGTTEI